MAQLINHVCDGCGKILIDRAKNPNIQREHIQLNGQLVEQNIDEDTGVHFHLYITPSPTERLAFCKKTFHECLGTYMENRLKSWKNKRHELLSEIAEAEYQERKKYELK